MSESVSPSVLSPAAAAPPAAPAAVAAPVVPTPAPAPADTAEAKLKRLEADFDQRKREHVIERRKHEAAQRASSEKLTKLEQLERRDAMARMNPPAFLQQVYGENWYDVVVQSKMNGVPPAQLIQAEMERFRTETRAEIQAERQRTEQSQQSAQQQQVEQARAALLSGAKAHLEASAAEYPLLVERYGEEAPKALAEFIEAHFHKTTERDGSGYVLRQGQALLEADAAVMMEGREMAMARKAAGLDKYRGEFETLLRPPTPPATVGGKSQPKTAMPQQDAKSQPRRTLTNSMTGSSTQAAPDSPRMSPQERRAKANARYMEALRKREEG
jgi:hypothetical protein